MTRFVVAILMVLPLLAGCSNRSQYQPGRGELFASRDEMNAKDDAICRSYGATPGTPVYIQCRVEQDKRRQAWISSPD